eukprot:TRINITY_DN9361_c0_g1_i1.p1 TRINITY_DN9361_c0_g1~~TRINITY_DN9361_c0_g1_i1.p1  ORF type:complete len:470 (-),score=64.83 TRINITY_DN9361_c0_g1_i1:490-1899(-)
MLFFLPSFTTCVTLFLTIWVIRIVIRTKLRYERVRRSGNKQIVGFFHPNCAGGGGGERVLWCAIREIQTSFPETICVIYTVDTADDDTIKLNVKRVFDIDLPKLDNVIFVRLRYRKLLEASTYPWFTMVLQSLGSAILGAQALWKCYPHIFVDTAGHAFTYPLVRLLGNAQIGCYTHYPTISTDMLQRVSAGSADYNHRASIAKSPLRTQAKLLYYRIFAMLYRFMGMCTHQSMANSHWTAAHIRSIWGKQPVIVFPPCPTAQLVSAPLQASRSSTIVSVAQFRPEKNHPLMLDAFAQYKSRPDADPTAKLLLLGGCRVGTEDTARVEALRSQAQQLGIAHHVDIQVNVSYQTICNALLSARVHLHCMRDEHFGIGIVEGMAAGAVPLAHRSAGPLMDIVVPFEGQPTGLLAVTAVEYAEGLHELLSMSEQDYGAMQQAGRKRSQLFSEEAFAAGFREVYAKLRAGVVM